VIVQWYYSRDLEVSGPFCDDELASLAAAGTILPTDTVWKEGVEQGVLAHRVRHLFPSEISSQASPVTEGMLTSTAFQTDPLVEAPSPEVVQPAKVEVNPTVKAEAVFRPPASKPRAVAGKGVVIVGQDGKTVRYRMKCPTCSFEESSWKCMPITRGTMRVAFFCQKCRKQRQSDIQGHMN